MTFKKKHKPTSRIMCPLCDGDGWTIETVDTVFEDVIMEADVELPCPLCDGEGFIEGDNDNGIGQVFTIN